LTDHDLSTYSRVESNEERPARANEREDDMFKTLKTLVKGMTELAVVMTPTTLAVAVFLLAPGIMTLALCGAGLAASMSLLPAICG
jgi:hypothetical protein